MGWAEEAFDELVRCADEVEDYDTSVGKHFYILRERPEGRKDRIKPVGLASFLPIGEIRRNFLQNLTSESCLIPVEGSFFPDFLDENGVYFVSLALSDYLKEKLAIEPYVANTVCFVGEGGKRVEEYVLLVPETVDCVLPGTGRVDKAGFLEYFEIDGDKVGGLDLFKVKGFSQLIVTEKIPHAGFSGFECVRIENAFGYETERDRVFQQRLSGERLAAVIKTYDAKADATGDSNYKYGLQRVLDKYAIEREISEGLKRILDSHTGELFAADLLADRFLLLFWSWRTGRVQLAESHAMYFAEPGFTITKMEAARDFVEKLPEELKIPAKNVCFESILYFAAQQLQGLFSRYPAIHEEVRFRIYLHDITSTSMNPPLICDYKRPFQRQAEQAASLHGLALSRQDLREFDFSGKDLSNLVIEGSDLRRVKFHGANLKGITFKDCNLLGAEFTKANLTGAKFIGCQLEKAIFSGAELADASFSDCDLWHCKFLQCNMDKAVFRQPDLAHALFYACKMPEVVFAVPGILQETVFSLCCLAKTRFLGDLANPDNILSDCNFCHADLTGAEFVFDMVACCNFSKAKLLGADFSHCGSLSACDFNWADFTLVTLPKAVDDCSFYAVDLSRLKQKRSTVFAGNDFSHANLSGYDFGPGGYCWGNVLRHTNLSGCILRGADFRGSHLREVKFDGANLKGAKFLETQLNNSGLSQVQLQDVQIITKKHKSIGKFGREAQRMMVNE